MSWLVEQCFRNEGYWAFASLLSVCIFCFDERSWTGLARSGYKFELQRYRTRMVLMALSCVALSFTATLLPGFSGRLIATAGAVGIFHLFQKLTYDFGGISMSGAGKRILLGVSFVLVGGAMIPYIQATFIPLMFVVAGASASLSSRNHLFFNLSQETDVLRQRLFSEQANRHNRYLFSTAAISIHSSDDNVAKAG